MFEFFSGLGGTLGTVLSTFAATIANLGAFGFGVYAARAASRYLPIKKAKSDHDLHELTENERVRIQEIARQINTEVWNREEFPLTESAARMEGEAITLEASTNLLILERQLGVVNAVVENLRAHGLTDQTFEEMMRPGSTVTIRPLLPNTPVLAGEVMDRLAKRTGLGAAELQSLLHESKLSERTLTLIANGERFSRDDAAALARESQAPAAVLRGVAGLRRGGFQRNSVSPDDMRTLIEASRYQPEDLLSVEEVRATERSIAAVRDNLDLMDRHIKDAYNILGMDIRFGARDALEQGKLPDFENWVSNILADYPKTIEDIVRNNGMEAGEKILTTLRETGHLTLSGAAARQFHNDTGKTLDGDQKARQGRNLSPSPDPRGLVELRRGGLLSRITRRAGR